MKLNIKEKKILMLIALIICCISGVYAYWTQTLIAHNEFETARYNTELKEEFVPPSDWKPGEEINKDVWIKNESSIPVFAKMIINQSWKSKDKDKDLPLTFKTESGEEYAALINFSDDVVLLESGKKSGQNFAVKTVKKVEDAEGKWLLLSDEPDKDGNLELYYIGMIDPDSETVKSVDSVTMNQKIQPGVLEKHITYNKETGKQELETVENPDCSYEGARYTMLITAHTVQATGSAVKEVFADDAEGSKQVIDYLAAHGLSEDIID